MLQQQDFGSQINHEPVHSTHYQSDWSLFIGMSPMHALCFRM
jgi:hypothetical protein